MQTNTLKRFGIPLLGALAFLLLWELATDIGAVRPIILPSPSSIFRELASEPAWFAEQAVFTVGVALLGFGLAVIVGVVFAIAIVEWPLLDRLLFPLFIALNSVPKVAIAPLFIIWFGTGAEPKIAIAALIAVFAIVIDTALGLHSVPPDQLDLAKVLRGSRLKVLLRIKMYCALPHMFAGFKVALSLSLVGAIVGEFVSSQKGLGFAILTAQGSFDTPRVFAAIFILSLLGVALIGALDVIERMALPWHASQRKATGH
ncbi:ABC transporter permease [Bradyrhizobium acaciae]|uniref:ABC transporter permease n=1 Tax=Bradyrhizobium acaciae TaxID=2683706 RepID=UPI001E5A87C4|nr:ABC transporter permease [Bradyrhizobium acaciae]MCC8977381.1 ABC transporter permease [Bradyrhizobium acaciae]